MAAITGKFALSRGASVRREVIDSMTAALAHRGRGGGVCHLAPGVGIGHRQHGPGVREEREPASNENDTVRAAADSALSNVRELRSELRARGHFFATTSDAEVIVHGYETWGDGVVEHLRGPFAFVLWDARNERLLLARDPLGIRPLFYCVLDEAVVFGSELKALLEDPSVPREWDPSAIKEYLALGYIPSPATAFRRILKLPPGHALVAQHGRVRVKQYWDLAFGREPGAGAEREYRDVLDDLVRSAVDAEIGDGQAAVLVSGRVPSAVVAASLARTRVEGVVTVTAGAHEGPFDHVHGARSLARRIGSTHYTELVSPRTADLLPRLAWHLDEPFGDPSTVTAYYLCVAAGQHSSVAATGHGGGAFWPPRLPRWKNLAGRLQRLRDAIAPRPEAGDFLRTTAGLDPFAALRVHLSRCTARDRDARALYLDLKTTLSENVLVKLDRMSHAACVELRLPLLDRRLVEFAAGVPASRKLSGRGKRRHPLMSELLPPGVRDAAAAPQHRFSIDAAELMRGGLATLVSDVLLSGRFRSRGIFRPKTVTKMWQEHLTGRRDHHRQLWSMLMLELWFEQFVDAGNRAARAA